MRRIQPLAIVIDGGDAECKAARQAGADMLAPGRAGGKAEGAR